MLRLIARLRLNYSQTQALYIQHKAESPFTSQILSLATRLNLFYNTPFSGAGSIYIKTQGRERNALYTFFQNENRPQKYLYFDSETQPTIYLYFENELQSDVDFIVYVPNSIAYDPAQLIAIVNKYKLAGKRFAIENV